MLLLLVWLYLPLQAVANYDKNYDQNLEPPHGNRDFHDVQPEKPPNLGTMPRLTKRNEVGLGGMSLTITHNLDILRQNLMRELNMRQREMDLRKILRKNSEVLDVIGRRRKR